MKKMKLKIINYLILIIILSIQAFSFLTIYFGGRGVHGNISLDLGGVSFLIFLLSVLHYKEVLKYIVPICLWTIGFYIIFQNNYTAIAGGILIAISAYIEYKLKSTNYPA